MPDSPNAQDIARRTFAVARRGYEQQEVRGFLHEVSAQIDRLNRDLAELRERADRAEAQAARAEKPDEAALLALLGEETTRVLTSAREAAAEIRAKAEEAASRSVAEATAEARGIREKAEAEAAALVSSATEEREALLETARTELARRSAEAEVVAEQIRSDGEAAAAATRASAEADLARAHADAEAAREAGRQEGRAMVAEAQAVRERILRDLAVRRKKARQQVEKLNAGRERLLEAYDVVRRTIDEATGELSSSLVEARAAADAAARRLDGEPDATVEEIEAEVAAVAATIDPADLAPAEPTEAADEEGTGDAVDDDETPGPFSGEVPAVVVSDREPRTTRVGGRKKRRRGFEGLPPAELEVLEPPAAEEGVRVLAEVAGETPDPAAPDLAAPRPELCQTQFGTRGSDVEQGPTSDPGTPAVAAGEPAADPAPIVPGVAGAAPVARPEAAPGGVAEAPERAADQPATAVFARLREASEAETGVAVGAEAVEPEAVESETDTAAAESEPEAVESETDSAAAESESETDTAAAESESETDTAAAESESETEAVETEATAAASGAGSAAESDADDADETEVAAEPAGGDEAPVAAGPTAFGHRATVVEPVDKELGRRIKRQLADEQNEVLDLLRRTKPKGVDDLLPDPDEHAGRWAEVVIATLTGAAGAGAGWVDGQARSVADLADELARSLTAPLRERIDRSFAASDGNLDEVGDRVRALYREWKGQRLVETTAHYSLAAFARGLYDGIGAEARVVWAADPGAGACPDCDDNVLGGVVAKGEPFPTGDLCAPAHPGCHCLVLPAP